jgi:hypothetical protein
MVIDPANLNQVVRTVLGEPDAVVSTLQVVNLPVRARSLHILHGTALVAGLERPWRLALKVLAPVAGQDDPAHTVYWKREGLLYGSGVLADLPPGIRAPRCYRCEEQADGSVWLWLEHVRDDAEQPWATERWRLIARRLGQFNGAYLAGRPFPSAPALGGRRLRTWLERHVPLVARIAVAPSNPNVRHWWPQPIVDAILRLWSERDALCDALEELPQTFGHGDAIRRNLLTQRLPNGSNETVAIDWEHAGYYAAGEEVGQTLSVAAAFFDAAPADLPALDEAIFTSYLAGLTDAGWQGDPRPVRFAYCAHAALRNLFNAVGTTVPDEAGRANAVATYGHTWEELAERRAEIRPFLLERASEAQMF